MTHPLHLLDGGMGRELLRRGAPFAQPEWSALALLEAPAFVQDVHAAFIAAGADIITFHPEASPHVDRTLQLIRSRGCKAGLVFNPATPLSWLDYTLDQLDIVLLMSVNPGFGGQSFIPGTLAKLRDARQRIDAEKARSGRDIWLEVDGGVKVDNIAEIAAAGADTFVAGSAVFGAPDPDGGYHGVLKRFREALA